MEHPNGSTLVIPTAFLSWTGEALDKKTPLLRSMEALSHAGACASSSCSATRTSIKVFTTVGAEQEYFLIDKNFYYARPDLITTGRTLFGATPPKGQELEDQYFGAIPERVLACMAEAEMELFKLGVPVKTRHNEVAPSQYEIAPIFENSNLATDHQNLIMEVLRKTADKYGLVCLLHEKPFAGINGSGKHNNWSMSTDTGENLLNPGDNPHDNAQFLVFCTAVIRAVAKYSEILRLSIASAHNDHRLGANEAPPAIISIFLGDQLNDIFEQIEKGGAKSSKQGGMFETGVVDPAAAAQGSRRPQPHAARSPSPATSSSSAPSAPAPTSPAPTRCSTRSSPSRSTTSPPSSKPTSRAARTSTRRSRNCCPAIIKESKKVIFNGNGYAEEWHKEAEKRGLPNLKNTVDVLPVVTRKDTVELFTKYKVYTEKELQSRFNILAEDYVKTVDIEGQDGADHGQDDDPAGGPAVPEGSRRDRSPPPRPPAPRSPPGWRPSARWSARSTTCSAGINGAGEGARPPRRRRRLRPRQAHARARLPGPGRLRKAADKLETMVADDLWPLPTYREMLFIK